MKANKSSLNDLRVPPALLARAFGVVPRHLQRLAKNGVLPTPEHGRYDLVPCVRAFIAYCEAGRERSQSLAEAQRMLTMQQVEKLRVFNQERAKTLIPASTVEQTMHGLGAALKATVDGMPDRHALRLCTERPAVEANAILREAATEILRAVSRWLEGTRCPELDEAAAAARERVRRDAVYEVGDDDLTNGSTNFSDNEEAMGNPGDDAGDDSRARNPKRTKARTAVPKTRAAAAAARRGGQKR